MQKCEHCKKEINTKTEGQYVYIGIWKAETKRNKVVRYHSDCFREIAGISYMKEIFNIKT